MNVRLNRAKDVIPRRAGIGLGQILQDFLHVLCHPSFHPLPLCPVYHQSISNFIQQPSGDGFDPHPLYAATVRCISSE